jgi:hypothetical protein
MDAEISDAVLRLLRSMHSRDDARILGPQLIREIVYRVLTGPQGPALRAMVGFDSHFSQICRALHQIHRDYQKSLNISQLAKVAGMTAKRRGIDQSLCSIERAAHAARKEM